MALFDFLNKEKVNDEAQQTSGNAMLPIGPEQVIEASFTLQKYKSGKANLERRIVDAEQWFKLRHWESLRLKKQYQQKGTEQKTVTDLEPTSAWLFNAIANKHADAMDNYPEITILPREANDKQEAKTLSSIIPVILEQGDFEKVYSDVAYKKLISGTGVYGVFWDASKLNGMGDIVVQKVDILSLFWESGITDIQNSKNVFFTDLMDNDVLEAMYPQTVNRLTTGNIDITQYIYDDTVDTSNKSVVVDWYYKKNVNGKSVLHYVKYVNDIVLFATENMPEYKDRGWYDHGLYPFVFDALFPVEGTPAGFGYVDVGKDAQEYIDRGNQAILKNMLVSVKPRFFIRNDGSINEEEYTDLTRDFIHTDGNLGQDSILPVQANGLSSIYVEVINNKIAELKETTGNRDISTGGTSGGVTASSAIAALQEAGSKLSRDSNKSSYRAIRNVGNLIVELIRQFYDVPRTFRITGMNNQTEFVEYSNENIKPIDQGMAYGMQMGFRIPQFDLSIGTQKQSPYAKMSQNELALQFYNLGFFNPQLVDQALVCLDMMDFDRKDFIVEKLQRYQTLEKKLAQSMQMNLSLAQMVDAMNGTNISEQIAAQINGAPAPVANSGNIGNAEEVTEGNNSLGGEQKKIGESSITKNARERVANSTNPN